jgi:hypothetical protein
MTEPEENDTYQRGKNLALFGVPLTNKEIEISSPFFVKLAALIAVLALVIYLFKN